MRMQDGRSTCVPVQCRTQSIIHIFVLAPPTATLPVLSTWLSCLHATCSLLSFGVVRCMISIVTRVGEGRAQAQASGC
jgi:hypothetical protein